MCRTSHPDAKNLGRMQQTDALIDNSRGFGRWPANLVLDENAAEMLDEQSGNVRSSGNYAKGSREQGTKSGPASIPIDGVTSSSYADKGGASRFFYTPKISKKERTVSGKVDNKHPTVKPRALMAYLVRLVTPPNGVVLDPFTGSGTTGMACMMEGMRFVGIERESESANIARLRIDLYERAVRNLYDMRNP